MCRIWSTKTILYFTTYFGLKDFECGFGGQPFLDRCGGEESPASNCYATDDREYLGEEGIGGFDAVMFHMRNMGGGNGNRLEKVT